MSAAPKMEMQGGAVRLTLSARAANDLDRLQGALRRLAEGLGHPACATGCDTLFLQLEREFTLDEAAELNPQPLPPAFGGRLLPEDPIPYRPIDVNLPDRVSSDIGSLQKAVALTLDKLGCPSCCSGFDIAFRREVDLISFNDDLEITGSGRFR
jgi:hypothetical protein